MARVHHVKAAKDYPPHGIKKGDLYFWWAFKRGGKFYSLTPPKPWQLTQSEYLQAVYQLQEDVSTATADTVEELEALRDDAKDRLGEIGEECREKLENMPESLQSGPTGELLEERATACEDAVASLDQIDLDDDDIDIPAALGEIQDAVNELG